MRRLFQVHVFLLILVPKISGEKVVQLFASEAFCVAINNDSFPETQNSKDRFDFIPAIEGMPDIPRWMSYRNPNNSFAFLYGTPPKPDNLTVEIVALNTRTYDHTRDKIILNIIDKENPARYKLQLKLRNFNVEDMFNLRKREDLLSIFKEHLWVDNPDVYLTQIASPGDIGASYPLNPKDKEGVFVNVGSATTYSRDLIDLWREVEPIKNRSPCPSRYKFTRVEHLFRKKNIIVDWCSFKMLK